MKTATTPLNNLLLTGKFVMADLYTITLNGGSVIRWTGADKALSFGGHTWLCGPTLDRGVISNKRGTEVSTFGLTIGATSADTVNGVALIPFVRANGLDGATLLLERAFLPTWADPITGTLVDFSGLIKSVKSIGPVSFELTVSSWMILLNQNIGPDTYQPACLNTLFDSGCTLTAATFAVAASVSALGTQLVFSTTLANADGYFNLGRMLFTSGANSGLSRSIKSYAGGVITLASPLPFAAASSDAFTAYPGCDLLKATCSGKFSNLIHFRGQPFVPVPEAAVQ